MTSRNSSLTLGSNPFSPIQIDGKLADIRLYSNALIAEEIKALKNFENTSSEYVSVISGDMSNLPLGVKKTTFDINRFHIKKSNNAWIYIPDADTYDKAVQSCTKYGGYMLNGSLSTNADKMDYYLRTIRNVFMQEIWIPKTDRCMISAASQVSVIVREVSCSDSYNFICVIPPTTTYKMVGVPPQQLPLTLVPRKLEFNADMIFKLQYENRMLSIVDPVSEEPIASLENTLSSGDIMGRYHEWRGTNNSGEHMSLTVSTCSQEQFTCDNGLCIDIYKVCDYVADCLDSTDEGKCNSTESRPSYYDSAQSGVDLLDVGVVIYLNDIANVDMTNSVTSIQLEISTSWRDSRVHFHNLHKGISKFIQQDDSHFYWKPNIKLRQVVHSDIYRFSQAKLTTVPFFLTPSEDGRPDIYGSYEGTDDCYNVKLIIYYHINTLNNYYCSTNVRNQ